MGGTVLNFGFWILALFNFQILMWQLLVLQCQVGFPLNHELNISLAYILHLKAVNFLTSYSMSLSLNDPSFTFQKLISQLKYNKGSGKNWIFPEHLKLNPAWWTFVLSPLFTTINNFLCLPKVWLNSINIPIDKCNNCDKCNWNYFPVSPPSVISTLYARLLARPLDLMSSENTLALEQAIFRTGDWRLNHGSLYHSTCVKTLEDEEKKCYLGSNQTRGGRGVIQDVMIIERNLGRTYPNSED